MRFLVEVDQILVDLNFTLKIKVIFWIFEFLFFVLPIVVNQMVDIVLLKMHGRKFEIGNLFEIS